VTTRIASESARRTTSSVVRVRYSEVDQMGFVYHPHYLVWCEIGRTDFIRELGSTYAEIEKQGLLLAVAEAQLRYAAPARYDNLVRIDCWLERVQSRSITFGYEIRRIEPGPEQQLVTATVRLVSLDANGALRTIPADLLRRFKDAEST